MNNLSAIVNLGRKDAIVRFTPNNKAVTEFSVALQSGYGDNQVTTWLNCSYWGERGEKVAQYLTKGTRIGINGELTNRKYVDKQGVEKYSLELRVSDLTLLGAKADSDTPKQDKNAPKAQERGSLGEDFEDDIPF